MRNPKFKIVKPNYKKHVLEVTLVEGKKVWRYDLPFSTFHDHVIGAKNRFVTLEIDRELSCQGVRFTLEDGFQGDFPADLVLYYCDPTYQWAPINQLKNTIKQKIKKAKLSVRVLANALHTSPSQVTRLLQENQSPKQLSQLLHLVELTGHHLEFNLKRKIAA